MFKAAKLNGIIPTCFTCFYVGDATMMNHQVWEKTHLVPCVSCSVPCHC